MSSPPARKPAAAPAPPSLATLLALAVMAFALAVMALGLAVMAGWLLGIEPLKRVLPDLVTMKVNTALGFLLAGGALLFRGTPALRLGLAGAAGLLGALTLGQYLAGADFGIDQLLIRDTEVVAGQFPGRMLPATALCLLLSGAALGLLGRRATETWAEALAISVGTVGLIALLGYALGAEHLYRLPGYISVALHTAAGFALLAAGVLCAVPGGTVALLLRSRGTARSLCLGFGVLTALLIVLGVVSANQLHAIGDDLDAQADVARPRSVAARELEANMLHYVLDVRAFLGGDAAALERRLQRAGEVAQHLAAYQRLAQTPRQQELAARFVAHWQPLHAQAEAIVAAGKATPDALAGLVRLRLELSGFLDTEMHPEAFAAYASREAATRETLRTTEALTLLLLVAGVVLALVTSGGVVRVVVGREEERERVAAALRLSEERFRLLFEQASDGILVADSAGRYTDANPAGAQMLGYTREEILCRGIADVVAPDELPQLAPKLSQYTDAAITRLQWRFRRKDGSEFDGEVVGRQLAGGGFHGMLRDISESNRVQHALSQNAALFSRIIEQAPGGVYVVDAQFRLQHLNAEALPVFASAQPLIGRDFDEVLEIVWGPQIGAQLGGLFRHTLATGERYVSPRFSEQRHDLGVEQAYEWEAQRITLPDGRHGVVCYFKDVTERERAAAALRLSEERHRTLFASMDEGFCIIEVLFDEAAKPADLRFLEVNGAFERQSGLEDAKGKRMRELAPQHEEHWFETYGKIALTGEALRFEAQAAAQGRWFDVNAFRVGSQAERRVAVFFNDITERKRMEHALRDAARRKDEFLATLAHELRNPLAPVRNAVAILHAKGPANPELQWAREVIDRQTQTMARLIDDLMDLSRINLGKIELTREPVELAKIVQGAVETSRTLIDAMGHELVVTLPRAPMIVEADLTRLAQVFQNLLNNAAKYTERGGRIELRATVQGSDAVVSVTDTGIGIAADKLPTLFEMFSQVEGALSRSQGGLGIGLSLVKRLVEMHGGRAEARSGGLGQGSEFVVRLPMIVERSLPGPASAAGNPAAVPSSDLRILVVDDNLDAAESLAMLLKMMGNTVHTAHDGEEAVTAAQALRPQVVLCDIGLPKLSGYEVCRRIRQEAWAKKAILVAVTGWGQDGDKLLAQEAGFDQHLVKPVDPRALMALLAGLDLVKA